MDNTIDEKFEHILNLKKSIVEIKDNIINYQNNIIDYQNKIIEDSDKIYEIQEDIIKCQNDIIDNISIKKDSILKNNENDKLLIKLGNKFNKNIKK